MSRYTQELEANLFKADIQKLRQKKISIENQIASMKRLIEEKDDQIKVIHNCIVV